MARKVVSFLEVLFWITAHPRFCRSLASIDSREETPMTRPACKFATVVARPGCSVSVCDHGLLHVAIGAVTLRLSSDSFEPIVEALREALAELQRADAALQGGWH